jgi:hypothetical protein
MERLSRRWRQSQLPPPTTNATLPTTADTAAAVAASSSAATATAAAPAAAEPAAYAFSAPLRLHRPSLRRCRPLFLSPPLQDPWRLFQKWFLLQPRVESAPLILPQGRNLLPDAAHCPASWVCRATVLLSRRRRRRRRQRRRRRCQRSPRPGVPANCLNNKRPRSPPSLSSPSRPPTSPNASSRPQPRIQTV